MNLGAEFILMARDENNNGDEIQDNNEIMNRLTELEKAIQIMRDKQDADFRILEGQQRQIYDLELKNRELRNRIKELKNEQKLAERS